MELNKELTTKKAGVIVLHEIASDSLILTQRHSRLRLHPGEICFPGGRWQIGDHNLYETALRELQEELGISANRIQLQQAMLPESTLTGYIIYPWLATIDKLAPYQLESSEVVAIFRLPMGEIIQSANYQEIEVSYRGLTLKSYQYTLGDQFVWGATVRIMMQLIK